MPLLPAATLAPMMIGATHYLDVDGKPGVIFHETHERAHMRLPDGKVWSGAWRLTETGYHVDWDSGVSGDWSLDNHGPGRIAYLDGAGARRAELIRIVYGNPENLPG